jgi:putative pyruvate formate lyase activating enzyme
MEVCTLCPRMCGAGRGGGQYGWCRLDDGFSVASVCLHHGEEPAIAGSTGVCNVFFSHCNLQCVYCQNHQISLNSSEPGTATLKELTDRIEGILAGGVKSLGFVSPSHMVPRMLEIIGALRGRGLFPVVVYNTNAYDRRETLEEIEDQVGVYLPDFKYMDAGLAERYSRAGDYPEVALRALMEMYRQKGSLLECGEDGVARSGLIIRHLILPGHVDNSIACLRAIAGELSTSVHVSLMAQYSPVPAVRDHPLLGRRITREEYDAVLEEFHRLGFYRGWVQELESAECLVPDFSRDDPFGNIVRAPL